MLNTIACPFVLTVKETIAEHLEMARLLAAATVSRDFQGLLLDDPVAALQQGYMGEKFQLTDEERDLVLSIRADSLPELARILVQTLEEERIANVYYPAQREQYLSTLSG